METFLGFQQKKEGEDDNSCSYKLVPWLSWDEWNFVRESLFSSSPDSIAAALRRVSAWRSRGCLPVAVDVTASIVEIQQKDPFFGEGRTNDVLESEEMLAMLYCMANMRLVNGVVEKTRKRTQISIAEAADAIGIPRMLIDIRHEGSHRDLPSLQLVRLASLKALDWLRSYYWEPQKSAIPFRNGGVGNVRKEIMSRLREFIFHLKTRQSMHSIKGKRVKQSELWCGGSKFFSRMAGKLQSPKSQGPKRHMTKILRNLVQLYSLYPSEVVSVLSEFLLKTSDSSAGNGMESSDNLLADCFCGNSKILISTIHDWKYVIMRLSSKEPELLLTIFKSVLEMIETREAMKSDIGHHCISSEHKAEILQIEHLSSLVPWLLGNLNEVKQHRLTGFLAETDVSVVETNVISKTTLNELLRKCLLILALGNKQLSGSTLLLAQMTGNSSLVERLKKLTALSFPDCDFIESSTCMGMGDTLLEQENYIRQVEEKLESLKWHRMKGEMVNIVPTIVDEGTEKNMWSVAKSWNPCPIGMLPRALGSLGILPILDRKVDYPKVHHQKVEESSEANEHWKLNRCRGKREATCDIRILEGSIASKKMRETSDGGHLDGRDGSSLKADEGLLMIDGIWKKVATQELQAIGSAVRILV
ncbi:uncharacterized protein LOC122065099 [Macadamia integrifolia]|uniref:uncharacterized protein LOC122065099 n=1 Tax=Macadamia integrifolia TaxID=60698 RepID=UPI001C4F3572|nr:uncharacterized protein LOC122065099 [Macadamia integrifolia]XP_042484834.1 uncharacterized protein LOC122065099 [Macadamia integrifolia]XP_042484835.1 uncharacterized protein LOC122065099 [Macadamia integrifolia]